MYNKINKINYKKGMVNKMKKISILILVALSQMFLFSSVQASATNNDMQGGYDYGESTTTMIPQVKESVGGGTWNHGISPTQVWSEYLHMGKMHSATSKNFSTSQRREAVPGSWARTSLGASLFGNEVFWSTW